MTRSVLIRASALVLAAGLCLCLTACNRAAVRIPGASLSFPQTRTGFVAKQPIPATIEIAMPVDTRSAHYGEPVARSKWDGCRTDALWVDSAPTILQERLREELASSNLFPTPLSGLPPQNRLVLKSEIHAFCSQAVGVFVVRIAGIAAVKFSIERDGKVLWEQKIERVVTDADADYSGSQVGFIEQAMRTAMADSLRLLLRDLLKEVERDLPNRLPHAASPARASHSPRIIRERDEG